MTNDDASAEYVEAAAALGREHGKAAASWVFDGNTDQATYADCIAKDEEGDPEWHDRFGPPNTPLSGEWADSLTPNQLCEEVGLPEPDNDAVESWADVADQGAVRYEICQAYEDAYYDAWHDEVLRMAIYQVESNDDTTEERA